MTHDPAPEDRNLIVLDLDETLIHASDEPLDRPADFRVGHYHVYRRPFLSLFLDACAGWYDLGVWSSASDPYVVDVVENIFTHPDRLRFVWGASKATVKRTLPGDYEKFGAGLGDYHYQKRLAKLKRFGWPLERMLIVDDSPEKCAANYGNAIPINPFKGAPDDEELRYLASYLHRLRKRETYRDLEKRRWRSTVDPMVL